MSALRAGRTSRTLTKAVLQWWRDWTRRSSALELKCCGRTKWSVWPKISACPLPNFAASLSSVPARPTFCCAGWQRSTSTATRCHGPSLERSRIFSEFAQCVTIIAAVGVTLRAIPLIRHGKIIARTPQRSWRSTRSLGVRGMSGN